MRKEDNMENEIERFHYKDGFFPFFSHKKQSL